jgi:sugar phosphate permease
VRPLSGVAPDARGKGTETMSLVADLMIVIGAILLTFGTDLVISSARAPANVGAPLGLLVSVIGTTLLASGLVINRRRRMRRETAGIE